MKESLTQKKAALFALGALLLIIVMFISLMRTDTSGEIAPETESNAAVPLEEDSIEDYQPAPPVNHRSYVPVIYLLTWDGDHLLPLSLEEETEDKANSALAAWLVGHIFDWPYTRLAKSPVPKDLPLPQVNLDGNLAIVNFPPLPEGFKLDPDTENKVIRSILLTLTEIPQVEAVSFLMEGEQLDNIFGEINTSLPLKRPSYINHAENTRAEGIAVRVWFSDSQALFAVPVTYRADPGVEEPIRAALEHLTEGPVSNNTLTPAVPIDTSIIDFNIIDTVVEVDFSRELVENHMGGTTGEAQTLRSLVLTATEHPQGRTLQILVEGEIIDTIAGHYLISGPLSREPVNLLP